MLNLNIPITKVDAAQRLVYGVATAEVADRAGEICDYASTKPKYESWSAGIRASSGGKSFGNLRAMHGKVAAGKVTALTFNDAAKQIEICAKIVDDAEWAKVAEGVYTGFSQGGLYAKRWTDASGARRYTAEPQEISLVDLPCLAEARFEMVKADGTHEWRGFKAARGDVDQAHIQALHDTAVQLGACCDVQKGLDVTRQFEKVLGAIAEMSARLQAIEDQPLPLPFGTPPRAVAKSEESDALDALLADPGTLSLLAIKLAQRQSR